MSAFRIIRRLKDLLDVDWDNVADGDALVRDGDTITGGTAGGGGGGVTDADYLVGTANAGLSAEIVVGTSPGGELGGTWASPTVDATHSGSSHAEVQAAAEGTAAAALATAIATEVSSRNTAIGVETTNRVADVDAEESARISAISGLSSVYQAKDTSLDYFATVDPSANVKSILTAADHAAVRTLLGLVIGTNVQAFDADLSTWAGLTPSAFFQTLVDDADAAAARTTLGITSGAVATDAIFDAKGDLAVGTGADTAAKLTAGANGTVPTYQSGQATGILPQFPPGYEIGYKQITAGVNVASTTEASGTTIITADAYVFDGTAVICVFYSPFAYCPSTTNGTVTFSLFEGSTQIGQLGTIENGASPGQAGFPIHCTLRFTPSAASHTYKVTAHANITTGTPAVTAGAGGTGAPVPAYVRFIKV